MGEEIRNFGQNIYPRWKHRDHDIIRGRSFVSSGYCTHLEHFSNDAYSLKFAPSGYPVERTPEPIESRVVMVMEHVVYDAFNGSLHPPTQGNFGAGTRQST